MYIYVCIAQAVSYKELQNYQLKTKKLQDHKTKTLVKLEILPIHKSSTP